MFASETWSLYVTILLVVYALIILFFVIRGNLRTKNMNDFAIGSGFPAWAVGLSLAASMTSAATFIINPGFIALIWVFRNYLFWNSDAHCHFCLPDILYQILSKVRVHRKGPYHGTMDRETI